ncbi:MULTISPECIES: AprI/Inh family metalloprotease inhibitor [unclassified Mesorhizobium]|uniref:AprI/Inh family metalloprotease inhibitor n=1 Tax=unclassified Mesorhizobium TaxID=325217 RepID=UPI0030151968
MKVTKFLTIMLAAAGALSLATMARAQSVDQFVQAFNGSWQLVDARYSNPPSTCNMVLGSKADADGRFAVEGQGCRGEAALVKSWGVSEGQMTLFDAAGAVIARLGGSQRRISGTSASGSPLIFEKVGVAGTAAMLEAARRAGGCFYSGFTSKCVDAAEAAPPAPERASVQVLVNLNVRAEARDDAEVVGVVPTQTCVTTELCLMATDGAWCRAKFGERTGWMRKLALRQNRWAIVTFENSCPKQGS